MPEKKYGGTLIDFSVQPPIFKFQKIGLTLAQGIGVMSDRKGKLQFYTNGCEIVNADHQLIANGDSLNYPSREFREACSRKVEYGTHNGLLPLPVPGSDSRYVLFHLRYDTIVGGRQYYPVSLLYTVIDMSLENGKGRVTEKNVELASGIFNDQLCAVRHGNGRDWWIAVTELNASEILLYQLTPYGIEGPLHSPMPLQWKGDHTIYAVGQEVFSPNGGRYARFNTYNGIQLFDFDRCTGIFSCGKTLDLPHESAKDDWWAAGVAFSPSSRFLYTSTGQKMYQFDCADPNPNDSRTFLGEYDGFKGRLWTTFYQQRLAPDGKIYMSASNGVYFLHVINYPDKKGDACEFIQHGIELPSVNGFCLPNFPVFNLYDQQGGPCDSLGIDAPQAVEASYYTGGVLRLFPNPVHESVTLVPPACAEGYARIFSAAGALVFETQGLVPQQPFTIDIRDLPAGMYFVSVGSGKCGGYAAKMVVW